MRLDDERHDAACRGVEEPVRQAEADRDHEEEREREVASDVDDGQSPDHDEARDIGDDHQHAARVTVGQGSADEQRRQQGEAVRHEDDRK